jgi:hypothetical protein
MRGVLAIIADVIAVVAFVVIGRASHHAGETLAGIATTAWPFLAGLAIGEAAARAWRHPLALLPTAIVIWVCTVAGGQILRVVSGQGTELAFVLVSAAFLGLFLLGWRLLVAIPAWLARRTA